MLAIPVQARSDTGFSFVGNMRTELLENRVAEAGVFFRWPQLIFDAVI